jgi:hypothetical protein
MNPKLALWTDFVKTSNKVKERMAISWKLMKNHTHYVRMLTKREA